jgi:hypothetical protein
MLYMEIYGCYNISVALMLVIIFGRSQECLSSHALSHLVICLLFVGSILDNPKHVSLINLKNVHSYSTANFVHQYLQLLGISKLIT